ncbi:Putative 3-hydroxyacyl-CoA dehydrogenase [Mycobacterium tuberculosis]|nr:Putative 3-hydroxyacyl-CoA dehydrogenase [Mycobacterium tuberculosis]
MTGTTPKRMVVIGSGTMGRGIALSALRAGLDVDLVDVEERALQAAGTWISGYFARHPRTEPSEEPPRGRLATTRSLDDVLDAAGVVVEAVPETPTLKEQIFGRLKSAPSNVLLASNTSTMSVSALAEACGGSAMVIGMHFFNPAHKMPLVEVVTGDRTSDEAKSAAVALARRLGKEPIVVRDVPGFVTSRLGLLLGTEAMRMVEEGVADAASIDRAMTLGYGHPLGPLRLADLVGLDARLNNLRSMFARTGDERYRPPGVLERLVAEGRLGRKSGRGFFDYDAAGATAAGEAR